MGLLSQQVAALLTLAKPSSGLAEINRKLVEQNQEAIITAIERNQPIGETEIAKRTGLTRTCVNKHLHLLEQARKIRRANERNRAPWVVCHQTKARLVTFQTEEDENDS